MKIVTKYVFRIAPVAVGLVTIVWWIVRNKNNFSGTTATKLLLGGRICGIILALMLLYLLLQLGAKYFSERAVSKPKLFKIHRVAGAFIILPLLVGHIVFVIAGRAETYRESFIDAAWRFVTFLPWGTITVAGGVILLTVLIFSYLFMMKKIKASLWRYTHYLVYPALILTVFHQFIIGNDFVVSRSFWWFWLAVNLLVGGMIVYSKIREKIHLSA